MTTTPGNASSNLPGRPPVVDLATWQAAREELLVREKAHTRAGDALAAARRRLPMVEVDGAVEVTGVDGRVPFVDLFQGRDELVVYHSMWYDAAPHQGQCEGCTFNLWHMRDAVYLNARGVSFAVLSSGPWNEVAPYVEFMGYTQPWYSVRGVEAPLLAEEGHIICFPSPRRPRVPHLLHHGPGQRTGRRVLGPARRDALRPSRGVGGRPRGLARGPSGRLAGRWAWRAGLLVLARGRRRGRRLGPHQPGLRSRPAWRDPRGDPRPPGHRTTDAEPGGPAGSPLRRGSRAAATLMP